MSKLVAMALCDALRATRVSLSEAAIPLLQLLAWDKLNREHPELQFPDITTATQASDWRTIISRGLDNLQHHSALGDNARAFAAHGAGIHRLVEELSEVELGRVLDLLGRAREQRLDYHAMLAIILDTVSVKEFPYNWIPDAVVELMVRLADISPKKSVYCPFEASLKLAGWSNRQTPHVSFESSHDTPLPFLLNLLSNGSIKVSTSDPIKHPGWVQNGKLLQFDVSIASPPMGVRYGTDPLPDIYGRFPEPTFYGDVLHLRHLLAHTRERVVVVVANGMLFRTAAGEGEFKEYLVRSGRLEAVIGLPESLLPGSGIACSVLVLNSLASTESVLFVDAKPEHFSEGSRGKRVLKHVDEIIHVVGNKIEGPFSRLVSRDEVSATAYNLSSSRYVASGPQSRLEQLMTTSHVVALEELADLFRPQSLKKDELPEGGAECFEVSVSDIDEANIIQRPKKRMLIAPGALKKLQPLVLRAGDILLAVKGSAGKVGFVASPPDGLWLANQSFQVIRVKDETLIPDPVLLFRYLVSPAGKVLLESRVGGSVIAMIQTFDVRSLPVIVPSPQDRCTILNDHQTLLALHAKIRQLRDEAEELRKKNWAI